MWMTGYNEHGGELNLHDTSFNGTSRRLRPLIPRPLPNSSNNPPINSNPPYFFPQYQHLGEQNKRELNTTPQVVVSSRWNPTPEQLRALEELYRRGTRTPSAEQIQHITAQLRRYGKIEGKNVFYWFQNHKARERQKRRRQMELDAPPPPSFNDIDDDNNKELGGSISRTVYEVEQQQTKNWPLSSNCSTTLAEESHVSIQRAVSENNNNNNNNDNKVVAGSSAASILQGSECGWFQLGQMELHNNNRRNINIMNSNIINNNSFLERYATWHNMVQLSNCPATSPSLLTSNHHLFNTPTSTSPTSTITSTANINNNSATNNIITNHIVNSNTTSSREITSSTMHDQTCVIKNTTTTHQDDHLRIFIPSSRLHHQNGFCPREDDHHRHGDSSDSQTLQLFPLRSCNNINNDVHVDKETINSGFSASTPYQFFEFLPLKN